MVGGRERRLCLTIGARRSDCGSRISLGLASVWTSRRRIRPTGVEENRTRHAHLILVTSHPLATADLHMREPRNPVPPATTSFFLAAEDAISPVTSPSTASGSLRSCKRVMKTCVSCLPEMLLVAVAVAVPPKKACEDVMIGDRLPLTLTCSSSDD
jgi:hypothetical protein